MLPNRHDSSCDVFVSGNSKHTHTASATFSCLAVPDPPGKFEWPQENPVGKVPVAAVGSAGIGVVALMLRLTDDAGQKAGIVHGLALCFVGIGRMVLYIEKGSDETAQEHGQENDEQHGVISECPCSATACKNRRNKKKSLNHAHFWGVKERLYASRRKG